MATYYQRKFKCECQPNVTILKYKWSDDETLETCSNCKLAFLEEVFDEINEAPSIGGKFPKGRSQKEKTQRRLKDFKQNTLETLPKWEKAHFQKKLKNNGL